MSIRDIWKYWGAFWLRPESAIGISAFRILFGMIVLQWCLLLYPDLKNWFGFHGIASLQNSQEILSSLGPPGLNVFAWLPPVDASIVAMFWFTTIAAATLTVGFFTRTSALCVYLGVASFQQQNCLVMNGGDILLKMTAFYLIFSAAGNYFSIDSVLKRNKHGAHTTSQNDPSGWPQRLYRFLIALIYFQAFWSKMGDPTWLDGSALYYVLREQEFARFSVPWIADSLWLCQALTWGSLLAEGAMWSLVWFKETRYFVLAGVLALHLGIEYTMNLPVFESLMIASLIVFVPASDLQSLAIKVKSIWERWRLAGFFTKS